MNPLMGLNKSKTKSATNSKTNSSTVKNTQDQGKGKSPENLPKKSLEKSTPKFEGTQGRLKTSLKSSQNMNIAEKASMSKEPEPRPVPKIIVTRASKDSILSNRDLQRTIKDKTDFCPIYEHTSVPYSSPGKSSAPVKRPPNKVF